MKTLRELIFKWAIKFFVKRGYYVAQPHFYNPIPEERHILSSECYCKKPYPCHGIDFNDKNQLLLCEQLSEFVPEIKELAKDILDPQKNQSFLDMDLEFLYGMIRVLKPQRFIEVGAGWSSLIAMQAIGRNRQEGHKCEHIIIEPYPRKCFQEHFAKASQYIEKPVQEVPFGIFDSLRRNDILFIDTSHVAKYGSDVNYIYFHIIPRVKPGCYIHIHDIFIPDDYPEEWIHNDKVYFNEQYLVMAFLMYNSQFKIRLAAQYMSQKYKDKLIALFPRFHRSFSPGSLWIQRS